MSHGIIEKYRTAAFGLIERHLKAARTTGSTNRRREIPVCVRMF